MCCALPTLFPVWFAGEGGKGCSPTHFPQDIFDHGCAGWVQVFIPTSCPIQGAGLACDLPASSRGSI